MKGVTLDISLHPFLKERRRKAGVPEEVDFSTKPQIALEQNREAYAAGLPRGVG